MTITAAQVKDLRERTGLGMMECKGALTETQGDMDAAIDLLRKKAGSKVEKKSGRTAAEGAIGVSLSADRKLGAMVEVNSETDFVAKGDDFQAFANAIAAVIARHNPADVDALSALKLDSGETVAKTREGLVAKLGENISVRRFARVAAKSGQVASYLHGRKIGVLVEFDGGQDSLGRDIAMHIAASRPECVSREQVSDELIAREKEIFIAQAAESGKPPEIIEKMVSGRINKYLGEITLLGQPFVKDPETTVEKLLKQANARVTGFTRYEVGEGIEKKSGDFAAEVMAQVKGG
jgi:elongation factor Ts